MVRAGSKVEGVEGVIGVEEVEMVEKVKTVVFTPPFLRPLDGALNCPMPHARAKA